MIAIRKFFKLKIFLLLFALAIQLCYLHSTSPWQRGNDVDGHADYIKFLIINNQLPQSTSCWECYHPPLYYFVAAVYAKFLFVDLMDGFERNLQYLAVAIFFIFQMIGTKIIVESVAPRFCWIALIMFLFWPSGIINSVRIGNDLPGYLFHAATMLSLILWCKNSSRRPQLIIASIFASLALLIKFNGIVVMAMVGIVALLEFWRRKVSFRQVFLGLYPTALIFLSAIFILILIQYVKGNVYDNTDGLPRSMLVGNSIGNIIYLDIQTYLNVPFMNVHLDKSGRQFFLNFLLKTSLFGASTFPGKFAEMTALSAGALFLAVLVIAGIGVASNFFKRERTVILVSAILSIAALTFYHVIHPYSCTADFRYIFPVIISVAVFFSDGCQRVFRYRGRFARYFYFSTLAIGSLFILSGVVTVLSVLSV